MSRWSAGSLLLLSSLAPSLSVGLLQAWNDESTWPVRDLSLAERQSNSLAAIAARGVRLPTSERPPHDLPDAPVLLVGADGTLHHDDGRGGLPFANPANLDAPHRDEGGPLSPPFVLAVDERTTWQSLQRAVEPFGQPDFLFHQWLLFGPVTSDPPGAMPRAPGVLLASNWPQAGERWCGGRAQLSLIGWLDEEGLRVQGPGGKLLEGCQQPETGVTLSREHLDRESLSRCIARLEPEVPQVSTAVPEGHTQVGLYLVPSPTTTWREIVLVMDGFRERRRLHTRIRLLDRSDQARGMLPDLNSGRPDPDVLRAESLSIETWGLTLRPRYGK